MKDKYYHKINNLDIKLYGEKDKYLMICQWSADFSHKWGIATFQYDDDEEYWYLTTYGKFNKNVDWYDFGCLVDLGYKWIKENCFEKGVNENEEI